jgi:N utilization substance protein A
VPLEDLSGIEGFDEDIANELRTRAQTYLTELEERMTSRRKELGVDDALGAIPGLTAGHLVALGEKGIKTLDDLADLAGDELVEMLDKKISADDANEAIMAARAHWFADEASGETPAPSA